MNTPTAPGLTVEEIAEVARHPLMHLGSPWQQRLFATIQDLQQTVERLTTRDAEMQAVVLSAQQNMERLIEQRAAAQTEVERLTLRAMPEGTIAVCKRMGQSYCEYEAPECCKRTRCPLREARHVAS